MKKYVKTFYEYNELDEQAKEKAREDYLEKNYYAISDGINEDLADIVHAPKDHGIKLTDAGYKVLDFISNTESGITFGFDSCGVNNFKAILTPYEIECLLTLCVKELKLDVPSTFEANVREIVEDTYYEREMDVCRIFDGLVSVDHRYYRKLSIIDILVSDILGKLKLYLERHVQEMFSDEALEDRIAADQELNDLVFDADGLVHYPSSEGFKILE